MERIDYPLLYFQLQESNYYGILVGTQHKAMADAPEALKWKLLNQLRKASCPWSDLVFIPPDGIQPMQF